MNIVSLTPWLPDFYTVQFPGSSVQFLLFTFVVVLLLVVQESTVYLPMPPSWPEVQEYLYKNLSVEQYGWF